MKGSENGLRSSARSGQHHRRFRRAPRPLAVSFPARLRMAALIAVASLFPAFAAPAATFTVNRSDDIAPRAVATTCNGVANDCTLREAVIKANATAGADTIAFAASTNGVPITLSRVGNDADSSAGDLDVNDSVTITGNGAALTIIQGATSGPPTYTNSIGDKVLGINQDGTHPGLVVSVSGVTIRWGRNTVPSGDPSFAYTGGGVDVYLTGTGNAISFTDCVITENENVNSYGGGVNVDSGSSGSGDPVGAFRGTVTFTRCTVSGNKAKATGGGLNLFADNHDVVVDNCTIQNNTTTALGGTGAAGGGINARHTNGNQVTIKGNTVISGNTAAGAGGGVFLGGSGLQTVLIQDTTISGNTSLNNVNLASQGGGLYSSGNAARTTTLTNVTISGNHANSFGTGGSVPAGGGVFVAAATLTVNGTSAVTGNDTAGDGGGIAVPLTGAALSMTGGSVTNNSAKGNGGGLFVSNSGAGAGGGATLARVTLTGNTANSDNTGGGDGGAIALGTGTLTVNYSRFSGNSANTGGGGTGTKGIRFTGTGTVDATNNWWGGEGNPGTGGTDGVSSTPGTVTTLPRLHLGLTASPTTLNVGGTSSLTASFLQNSAGTAVSLANLATLIGLPITFGGTLGGISGAQATVQASGTATATFTATAPGNGSATAQVDNLPAASAAIAIRVPVTVQASPTGPSFSVDSVSFTTAQSANWDIGSTHTLATTTPQGAGPGSRYVFSSWSDAGAISHSVTAPGAATTYTASFTTQHQLTTSVSPAGSGTVTPATGGYYNAASVVPIQATPGPGYYFTSWTGSVANAASAATTVTMSAPQSVTAGFAACPAISISPTFLAGGAVGAVYSQPLGSSGGAGATTFTIPPGSLPAGLTLSGGTITSSGSPLSAGDAGSYPITVTATDVNGCTGTRSYVVVITCTGSTLAVGPGTLPLGTAGTPYPGVTFTSPGATSFTLHGTLPNGLSFTGTGLAGTPNQTGVFPVTVVAHGAGGCAAKRDYYLAVAASCPGTTITLTPTLPDGTAGVPYDQAVAASGGAPAYTYVATGGSLPGGLQLDPVTGHLSGTPTVGGTSTFTITALDANGCAGSQLYSPTTPVSLTGFSVE